MPLKPNGVIVSTVKSAGKFNIVPINVIPTAFKADTIDSETILVTVQFQIASSKLLKRQFNFTFSDTEAYLAFEDVSKNELKLTKVLPTAIRQMAPGDDQPIELDLTISLGKGKVGGAGSPTPLKKSKK